MDAKQNILEQARLAGAQVTALREQVLDIVLRQHGVIKAYAVLAQMQQESAAPVAPPTAYRALDFWAAVNGYVLCSHASHQCGHDCHGHAEKAHHQSFILVCTECGAVDEQSLSSQWAALQAGVAASGFVLQEEHVVLTGRCRQCRQ